LTRYAGRVSRCALLLSRLTQPEREIVTARFGLDGRPPARRAEIAERLGMSVGRVRRLEQRALAKLAQPAAPAGSG
jgi:RNA polymerase sigma factor (sigma-70 family)